MARNASRIKLGYYPLPPAEGARLHRLLDFAPGASAVDPCAGTGAALHQLTEGSQVELHGVELDAARAAAAAASGIPTVHGNVFDTVGKSESFSFLYLNPPYDSEIGSMDNKRAHLLSLFGGDAEVGAIRAAIYEKHVFTLTFPDGRSQKIGFGPGAECYYGSLSLSGAKRSLRHLVAVSAALHANGTAGQTFLMHLDAKTKDLAWATVVSLLGLPADPRWGEVILSEAKKEKRMRRIDGIGCCPAVILGTREDFMSRIGQARSLDRLPFPEKNGPVTWPQIQRAECAGSYEGHRCNCEVLLNTNNGQNKIDRTKKMVLEYLRIMGSRGSRATSSTLRRTMELSGSNSLTNSRGVSREASVLPQIR